MSTKYTQKELNTYKSAYVQSRMLLARITGIPDTTFRRMVAANFKLEEYKKLCCHNNQKLSGKKVKRVGFTDIDIYAYVWLWVLIVMIFNAVLIYLYSSGK